MKKLLAILTALLLAFGCAAAEIAEPVNISLNSNPTTGFSWSAFVAGGDSIVIDDNAGIYTQNEAPADMTGVGGTTVFTLTPVREGISIVVCNYSRSWERLPVETRVYLVSVGENLKAEIMDITDRSILTGIVTDVNEEEGSVLLKQENGEEILAMFPDAETLPSAEEEVLLYTDGTMTMSLPAVVSVYGWETVPSGFARDGLPESYDDGAVLYPCHEIDMDAYGTEDSIVSAGFDAADIDENNCLIYCIYDTDLYSTEDIRSLQKGDTLIANGDEYVIDTLEQVHDGFDINGGFFSEEENGVTLVFVDGDPDHLCSVMWDDYRYQTLLGMAACPFAGKVTVTTFRMTEDGDVSDENDVAVLSAGEVKPYLLKLSDPEDNEYPISFDPTCTTVRVAGGEVLEITVVWTPAA